MMMMMFSPIKLLFASLLASVPVLSVPLKERDVVDPHILSPSSSSVWIVGSMQTVTWDTSNLPPYNQITNRVGKIVLGHLGGGGENLMLDHPLAQNFNITQGSIGVLVPTVPPRNDYIIVLMGDSGNASPPFAIQSDGPAAAIATGASGTFGPGPASLSSTLITTPIPITGSTITGGSGSASTGSPSPSMSGSEPSPSSPSTVSPSGSQPSDTVISGPPTTVAQTTSPATPSATSGAMSMHHLSAACFSMALIVSGLLL
ncbi:hypothetical protein AX17_003718 [Amanita inopinata Kibby_2008]|nr:hypothetical protein AX17_003718 [Amanita inopinata Kibby_2008]